MKRSGPDLMALINDGLFYYVYTMPNGTAFDKMMWRLAYLYLAIPFIIFCFGWLKWFYSIPLIGIIITACFFSLRQHRQLIAIDLVKHRRTIWICIALLVIWVFFSGIGQFSYQNGDHYARNAVLKDLVEQPWPLAYDFTQWQPYGVSRPGEYMMVYYLGYWMPAAVVGKMFGLQAAHVFLFVWTVLGVILIFYFICRYFRKINIGIVALFILFGGMDVIPSLIKGNYHPLSHLEWWHNAHQQYTSNTSLLYWVFNQSVVPWLIIAMLFNKLPKQNMGFACSLCFFYAPFAFLGLIPFAAYFFFSGQQRGTIFKNAFSFQNVIAAVVVVLVAYGYFSSVAAERAFNLYERPFTSNLWFYLVEFLVLSLILFFGKRKLLAAVVVVCLVVLSYIQYRHTPDLMMRASIPALFILMILAGEQWMAMKGRLGRALLFLILLTGSVTSLNEIARSIYYTGNYHYLKHIRNEQPHFQLLQRPDLFKGRNPAIVTILGDKGSVFFKIFCKKPG